MLLSLILGLAAWTGSVEASCKILFDGRIPLSYTPEDLTKNSSLYNPQFVLGGNQTWAEVIKFVPTPPSMFDLPSPRLGFKSLAKPLLATITDKSVFFPSPDMPDTGFRRSELIPNPNTGNDSTVLGTTTVHWSIRTDPSHPLNYSHEYHPFWHERNDFNGNHFDLETGTPFDATKESIPIPNPKTLRIAGWAIPTPEENVFITDFDDDVWHNFAITVGWTTNTSSVYYSKGYEPLRKVAGPFENDNSDGGQFHFGVFKLPTGPPGIDVHFQGYQEHIRGFEGLFYGGIFIEDSSDGCVTLSL